MSHDLFWNPTVTQLATALNELFELTSQRPAEETEESPPRAPLKSFTEGQLVELLSTNYPEVYKQYRGLAGILAAICSRQFKDVAPLAQKGLKEAEVTELRRALNTTILPIVSREWTSHGLARSFRYWSSAQKRTYLMYTNWVIEALSDEFLVCYGYGAVLAAIRDGDLLPHDDDLDLIVLLKEGQFPNYKAGFSRVFKKLENFGFSIRGDYVAHRHVCNERFFLDVFVGMEEDGFASWHPGPRKVIPTDIVFPTISAEMHGVKFPIPNDSEAYLRNVYGDDWRTPLPGWSHNFDPKPYKDWFFKK